MTVDRKHEVLEVIRLNHTDTERVIVNAPEVSAIYRVTGETAVTLYMRDGTTIPVTQSKAAVANKLEPVRGYEFEKFPVDDGSGDFWVDPAALIYIHRDAVSPGTKSTVAFKGVPAFLTPRGVNVAAEMVIHPGHADDA